MAGGQSRAATLSARVAGTCRVATQLTYEDFRPCAALGGGVLAARTATNQIPAHVFYRACLDFGLRTLGIGHFYPSQRNILRRRLLKPALYPPNPVLLLPLLLFRLFPGRLPPLSRLLGLFHNHF